MQSQVFMDQNVQQIFDHSTPQNRGYQVIMGSSYINQSD